MPRKIWAELGNRKVSRSARRIDTANRQAVINSFELTRFARIPKVIRVICFIAASSLCCCTNSVREPRATTPKPLRSASAPLKEELSRGPRGFHQIALTFDAGGEADALPALLDALRNAQIHATFFLTGDWVQHYPAYAAMIVNEGHDVGNHTHHHRDLTLLTDSEIADEIERRRVTYATI